MSRIGKKEIAIPSGVTLTLDGQSIKVKGPKGELAYTVPEEITVANDNGTLSFTPRDDSQRAKAMWGLSRTLTSNMVEGVTKGYEEVLELVGVGYRAALKGKDLSLQLGFSHEIDMPPPEGITFAVPRPVEVRIAGIDKQMVGEVAARIRRLRPPEPYKGKGVRYQGETVRRKEGKKK
jgi:large subunit ribosomal protein L6